MQSTDLVLASDNVQFSIEEYETLKGGNSAVVAEKIFFAKEVQMKLKQVKAVLNGGSIIVETGALHFMSGNISVTNPSGGVGGLFKKLATSSLTGEGAFNPVYTGTGEVWLEPSFGHFLLVKLDNETLICDKGMFYVATSGIDVSVAMQSNISSALFGGEGLFQTKLVGTGIVVLSSPVPVSEIKKVHLNGDTLKVDGNFALLRKGNVEFSVTKSSKGIFGTLASGEGLLQTFTGHGEVWIAPTQSVYEKLQVQGLAYLSQAQASSGNMTKTKRGFLSTLLSMGD